MLDFEFLYIISIPIYIILFVIFLIKKCKLKNIVIYTIFYFYIISLLAVTLFPIPIAGLKEISIYITNTNNFIPFNSILDILLNDNLPLIVKFKQVIGNIIIFIPLGFLVPFIWKNKNNFKQALIVGILSTIGIEVSQTIISLILGFNYKVTDIDDMILNTIGFIIGFYIFKKISEIKNKKK
ncbi:MAG: VanZ family protein [Candidatus Gracilibacteria bacterium]|nr:VanZ family protein [Candidatus Gracilibacteria bacterium]